MSTTTLETAETADTELVLETLKQRRAMPICELAALTGVRNRRVEEIVRELQRTKKVRLSKADLLDSVVTLNAR